MKKLIIVILLIGGGLYYTNPTFEDHKNKIAVSLPEHIDVEDESTWKDIEYLNYYLCSGTQSVFKKTLISAGIGRYVKVIDDKWPYDNAPKKK